MRKRITRPMEQDAKRKGAFGLIKLGDMRSFSKVITEHDIEAFADIIGDYNPIHMNSQFAEKTIFKGRIGHAALTAGLISASLGKFPGIIIYMSQNLNFRKPVRIGDKIDASAEVLEKLPERNHLILRTICKNQRDEIVADGEARVKVMETEDSS